MRRILISRSPRLFTFESGDEGPLISGRPFQKGSRQRLPSINFQVQALSFLGVYTQWGTKNRLKDQPGGSNGRVILAGVVGF